jgi:2,3-bisphosphoglycerate-independent phosphoglycerate mutase
VNRQDSRTGSHTPYGFFIATGEGIPAGQVLEGHSILDVAPTVLERAGVAIPADLEGRPIPLSSPAHQA